MLTSYEFQRYIPQVTTLVFFTKWMIYSRLLIDMRVNRAGSTLFYRDKAEEWCKL